MKALSSRGRLKSAIGASAAVAFIVANSPSVAALRPTSGSTQTDAAFSKSVDACVQPYLDLKVFSGSVLIAVKGRILLAKGYGWADLGHDVRNTPRTKFHIASISKTFTSAAIMLLAEKGKLKVEDPLAAYLPDYPRGVEITIHQLLTHTSGIPNINDFAEYPGWSLSPQTPAGLVDKFKNKPLKFRPGERYDYSNSNYNVLALLIERISGRSYGDFLREKIFEALGMKDTAHDGRAAAIIADAAEGYMPAGYDGIERAPCLDWSVKTGNGSIYSTVEDLYLWDRALSRETLLSRASLDRTFTPHVDGRVGYGWFVEQRLGRRCLRMNGRSPGFQAEIQRFVDDDACIIVLSNIYGGGASALADAIAAIVFGLPRETLALDPELPITPALRASYAGSYRGGPDFILPETTLNVETREGHLTLRWSSGGLSWLVPISESQFYDRTFGGRLTFIKDARGGISGLIYRVGTTDYAAEKVERPKRPAGPAPGKP